MPYLSALEVCSRRGAIQIHVYLYLVDDPTVRQPGFALTRQQRSLLNRFHTGQGHCGACRKKWKLSDSDQCSCGETQTMSHIVKSCPQTKLHGGLSKLHSADDDAVAWLTSYGSQMHMTTTTSAVAIRNARGTHADRKKRKQT